MAEGTSREPIDFAPPAVDVEQRADGSYLLRSPYAPEPYPDHLLVPLQRWAKQAPDRALFAERGPDGAWRKLTYAQAAAGAASIAQALIERGHGPDRPVAILSDNAIDHALVMFGAMHAGIPVMPVSPAYSLMSQDFAKLKAVFGFTDPSLIYVADARPFAKALAALDRSRFQLLVSGDDAGLGAARLAGWLAVKPGPEAAAALAKVGPDTNAKILLTSGSTGLPKGVINTHRMMCSNQVALAQLWRFARKRPPVLVDWLPWNHTFGGNFNINLVLFHGGTLYLDEGRPAPGRLDATIRNLSEISPTIYLNVPRGFDMLAPVLETDARLATSLMRDVDVMFFAGASMPQTLYERLTAIAKRTRGSDIPFITSLGSTETAPSAVAVHWKSDRPVSVGVPLPGTEVKLAPTGDKLEFRVRGPNVTPGYYKQPDKTREAFDEDGFFKMGDAVRFMDPDDPKKGLVFDGRIAEDFKLSSGTWVHAGTLRLAALAAAQPVFQDAVVAGQDRGFVGLLAFPSLAGVRALCPNVPDDAPLAALLRRREVVERVKDGLARHNADRPGSSTRIGRVMLMAEPPQIDASEITDKGYVNQRAVLTRRATLVERLYAELPGDDVIVIG